MLETTVWTWKPFVDELDSTAVIDLWLAYEHRDSHDGHLAGLLKQLDIWAAHSAVGSQKNATSNDPFNATAYQELWESRLRADGGKEAMSAGHTRCESAISAIGNSYVGLAMRRWLECAYWHGEPNGFLVPLIHAESRGALKGAFGSIKSAEAALREKIDALREKPGTIREGRAS